MYNALPPESVQVLVDVMAEFERTTDNLDPMNILANDGISLRRRSFDRGRAHVAHRLCRRRPT